MIEVYDPRDRTRHEKRAAEELAAARLATDRLTRTAHLELAALHQMAVRRCTVGQTDGPGRSVVRTVPANSSQVEWPAHWSPDSPN
jgi:hypothetical protein